MTVFVTQELKFRDHDGRVKPKFDVTPAKQYGAIKFLAPWAPLQAMATQPVIQAMRSKMAGFCDDDYLLPVGNPVIQSMAAAIAASINIGRVKFLLWDRQQQGYLEIHADLYK